MVHLVSERPRDALLPVLIEHCCRHSRRGYARPSLGGQKREPWWRTAFPVYYELLYLLCNTTFLVGSVLFLPIFEDRELSVNFSMTVLNVDKQELLSANRTLLDAFEANILSSVAAEAGPFIRPEHAQLEWHATKSCKLNQAIILDCTVFPPWGVNTTLVKERLSSSSSSLAAAVNRSICSVGEIQSITVGPVSVQMLSTPTINVDATPGKWAIDLGCDLFILGCAIQAFLSVYDLVEDLLHFCVRRRSHQSGGDSKVSSARRSHRQGDSKSPAAYSPISCGTSLSFAYPLWDDETLVDAKEKRERKKEAAHAKANAAEKALYFLGSFVFLVGTFYFQHPKKVAASVPSVEEKDVLNMAIAMFIGGSAVFVFAAFLNALSLTTTNTTFSSWAVAVCGIYECGGILFVVGSVCFMPNQGCGKGMEVMGAWSFITGSACYILGSCLEVVKTVALLFLKRQQEEAAKTIATAYSSVLSRRRLRSMTDRVPGAGDCPKVPLPEHPREAKETSESSSPSGQMRVEEWEEDVEVRPSEKPLQDVLMGRDPSCGAADGEVGRSTSSRAEPPSVPQRRPSGEDVALRRSNSEGPVLPLSDQALNKHHPFHRSYSDMATSRQSAVTGAEEAESPGLWATFFRAVSEEERQLLWGSHPRQRRPGGVEMAPLPGRLAASGASRYSESHAALAMGPL